VYNSAVLELVHVDTLPLVLVLEEAVLATYKTCCNTFIRVTILLLNSFGRSQLVLLDRIALEAG
jgi:hypothetical protein